MTTTIDAMKQAVRAIEHATGRRSRLDFPLQYDAAIEVLKGAITREEVQTVEPVGIVYQEGGQRVLLPSGTDNQSLERFRSTRSGDKLFTHPAPPPSGERAALIDDLRELVDLHTWAEDVVGRAANMLAADAQRDTSVLQAAPWPPVAEPAQQVAVPQGFGELIRIAAWLLSPEPTRSIDALEENTHIGHRQFSAAQEAMREVLRLKAIAIKEAADKLAAAPRPPQENKL